MAKITNQEDEMGKSSWILITNVIITLHSLLPFWPAVGQRAEMTGTRCSQNSHPCLGLLVVSTASLTHIEALLTPLAHETRISDNVIAYVTAASRLSRVYKLFARSCHYRRNKHTWNWGPVITSALMLKRRCLICFTSRKGGWARWYELTSGALERCRARLTANSQHLKLYSADVTHIFQQLKPRLKFYFRWYYPLATDWFRLQASPPLAPPPPPHVDTLLHAHTHLIARATSSVPIHFLHMSEKNR